MKILLVTYKCGSQKNRDDFYAEILKNDVGVKSSSENGCFGYDYFFPADEPTELLLVEKWADDAALEKHKSQPHFIMLQQMKSDFNVITEAVGCEKI